MKFKYELRNWTDYRRIFPDLMEVDFHFSNEVPSGSYYENMQGVWDTALHFLIKAQEAGKQHVIVSSNGIGG